MRVHRAHGQTPPGPDDQSPDFKSWHAGYAAETCLGFTDMPEISRNWGQILARDSSLPGRSKRTGMDTLGWLYGPERFSWKPGLGFIRNQKFAQYGRVWIKHFSLNRKHPTVSSPAYTTDKKNLFSVNDLSFVSPALHFQMLTPFSTIECCYSSLPTLSTSHYHSHQK